MKSVVEAKERFAGTELDPVADVFRTAFGFAPTDEQPAAFMVRPGAAAALNRLVKIRDSRGLAVSLVAEAWRADDWKVLGYRSYAAWVRAAGQAAHCPKPQESGRESVYFIQAETGGPVKIGVATRPTRRLNDLQTGSPVRLRILAVIPGVGYAREAELHARFIASRSHGEWFHPTAALMAYIAEHGQPLQPPRPPGPGRNAT